MRTIASWFLFALLGVSAYAGSEPLGTQGEWACQSASFDSGDDDQERSTAPLTLDVGLNLHKFATAIENCRRSDECTDSAIGLLNYLRIPVDRLPDPWSGHQSRSEETQKLLDLASRVWSLFEDEIRAQHAPLEPAYSSPTRLIYLVDPDDSSEFVRTTRAAQARVIFLLSYMMQRRSSMGILDAWNLQLFIKEAAIRDPVQVDSRINIPKPQRHAPMEMMESARRLRRLLRNDPLLDAQWSLERIGVLNLWEEYFGRPSLTNLKVALIDSGIDGKQRDLISSSLILQRFCSAALGSRCNTTDTADSIGHGTALAGILAATANNGYRIAGMHTGSVILSSKIFQIGEDGAVVGDVLDAARAIDDAVRQSSTIVIAAWGQEEPSDVLWEAILHARAADTLVITGAGNDQLDLSDDGRFFPASFRHPTYCQATCPCLDNLMVVGATKLSFDDRGDLIDKKASFSNRGKSVVDLGAPGVGITTLWLHDQFGGVMDVSGTSAAAAMVAGAAALVTEALPSDPPPRDRFFAIRSRLLRGADRVEGLCSAFAEGRRLNVYNAVENIPMDDLCVCSGSRPP